MIRLSPVGFFFTICVFLSIPPIFLCQLKPSSSAAIQRGLCEGKGVPGCMCARVMSSCTSCRSSWRTFVRLCSHWNINSIIANDDTSVCLFPRRMYKTMMRLSRYSLSFLLFCCSMGSCYALTRSISKWMKLLE